MTRAALPSMDDCNCLAVRQAARSITQLYDQHLAPSGLRSTQYALLMRLKRLGPLAINTLADELVMDRTTLARNLLPLERDGLIAIVPDATDRRSKSVSLTPLGTKQLIKAIACWHRAQAAFDVAVGVDRSKQMRTMLRDISAADLLAAPSSPRAKRPPPSD